MEQAPSLFGRTGPDRVYAGAAQAALYCGDKEKAKKYYFDFENLFEKISENRRHEKIFQWHRDTLKYLESQLINAGKIQERG